MYTKCIKDVCAKYYNILVKFFGVLTAVVLCINFLPYTAFAASERALTDLFYTEAFRGSWKVFEKLQWVGAALNFVISVFCFLGLAMVVFRVILTLLYLSNRNLFDTVDEIKGKGKGQKFFGFGSMGKEVFNANYGTGLDAVVGFLLALLPNIKAYSDYADGKVSYNLSQDDTITTYILKISLPTILTVFFFTIGFSGVLWQAYGTVVSGLATAADSAVSVNLDNYVEKVLNTGSNYKFAYDGDGTKFGDFRQKLAKAVYSKVIREAPNTSTDSKMAIGSAVDEWINSEVHVDSYVMVGNTKKDVTKEQYKEGLSAKDEKALVKGIDIICDTSVTTQDEDAKNLEYTVNITSSEAYSGIPASVYYLHRPLSELIPTVNDISYTGNEYIHIMISKKKNSLNTNYFEVKTNNAKNTTDNTDKDTTGVGDQLKKP